MKGNLRLVRKFKRENIEWAHIAQNRDGWHKRVAQPPFAIGKPLARRPRGDTRRTPE